MSLHPEINKIAGRILSNAKPDPLLVTIDGAAGTGKSSIARGLATILSLKYLDTGAMFRCIALHLGNNSWNSSWDWLNKELSSFYFRLFGSGDQTTLYFCGQPVGREIRKEEVGMWASRLGEIPVVREHLARMQQDLGRNNSLVAEGRDMGTNVFPWARFKFFLQADEAERARRRQLQLQNEQGIKSDFSQVLHDLRNRDQQDMNRETSPLKPSADAVIIDTTNMDTTQVLKRILDQIQAKLTV